MANGSRLSRLLVGLLEVLLAANGVGLHGILALLPVGGADFTVLVGELEGVNETESFVDGAPDGKIVDGDLNGGN